MINIGVLLTFRLQLEEECRVKEKKRQEIEKKNEKAYKEIEENQKSVDKIKQELMQSELYKEFLRSQKNMK